MGIGLGVIVKSGSWFSYDDMKIGQGRDKVKQYLLDNPTICDEVEKKIRDIFAKNTDLLSDKDEDTAEDDTEEKKSAPAKAAVADDDDLAEFSPEDLD